MKDKEVVDDSEREQFVINWAACAVAAAASAMKLNSKQNVSERASNTLKSNAKNSNIRSTVGGKFHQLDDKSDFYAACENPVILRLLQLLCGVASVLGSHLHYSESSRGKKKGNRLLHFDDTLAASDAEQQVDYTASNITYFFSIPSSSFSIVFHLTLSSSILPPVLLSLRSNLILAVFYILDEKHFNDFKSATL